MLRSYLGLLTQGKSDFDAIENFRGETFFKTALGIALLPSSPTLRQRMDAKDSEVFEFVAPMIETLLTRERPDYGVLPCGWLPLDEDTFAMDNGRTAKEGVGRTCAGVDGYCPLAAYLGRYGICLELALRPGVQHSAKETDFNLERVIPMAQTLTDDSATTWTTPREGKRLTLWEQSVLIQGVQRPVRRVLRLTERTINAKGQVLIAPHYTLDGWTTTLPHAQFGPQAIIDLYADHGTHGKLILGLGANDRSAKVFTRLHGELFAQRR